MNFFASEAGLSKKLYFLDKFLVCINITSDIDDIIIASKILNNIFYV